MADKIATREAYGKALVDLGLVEPGGKDNSIFALTTKGMTVAEHLSGIESAIHG